MDNSTNGQNPTQSPIQQNQPVSNQPAGPIFQLNNTVPQSPINQPVNNIPSSAQQPMQPSQPVQPIVQNQTSQVDPAVNSSPKITMEDLYGPSGFTDSQESTSQPNLQQPSNGPVPPPLQSPIQVQQDGVGTNSFASQNNPKNIPTASNSNVSIPDLPLVSTQPKEVKNEEISSQANKQGEEILNKLPLRKQQMLSEPSPVISAITEITQPAKNTNDSSSGGSQGETPYGINKLLLMRIFFGAVGAIIAIVLFFFLVTWLSGFFHSKSSGKVTLTYWGLWEDSNTMQSVISDFERQHPDIKVEYEKEDPKQYSQRLLTRIQQGNGPDIFTYHSSWLPMVKSILVPLPTSVISKSNLENNFYPVVRTDLVQNGALYGIPLGVDTLSLFVNNTLFKEAKAQVPTTWDSFGSTARALTQKDENGKIKVAGAALGTFDNITHAPDIISSLFVQNGVDINTMSPKSNVSDALSFYTSFATGDSNVWDSTLDPSQLSFSEGKLAMYFGYSWDIFTLKAENPNLDFSVYPIPHLPERNITIGSYWVEGVSAKSSHQKEALLFMQFLAQKNTEATLYAEEAKTRLFGEPYARSDLGATLKDNPLVYPFVEQATSATSSLFAGETDDTSFNGQMNGYLGNAVRSILNNNSPESAVDTLLQGEQQVQNQYASK